jgi:hypothetical protein
MTHQEEIARWDAFYTDYNADPTSGEERLAEEIGEILRRYVPPGASLLEAGCGSGHLSGLLARQGFRVALLDFSQAAIGAAQRYFQRAGVTGEFYHADLFSPGQAVGQRKYDVVWNSGVLEHYEAPQVTAALSQMARHSSHLVVALVPNADCFLYQLWRLKRKLEGTWTFGDEFASRGLLASFAAVGLANATEHTCGRLWALGMLPELAQDEKLAALLREIYTHQLLPPHLTDYLLVGVGEVAKRPRPRPAAPDATRVSREQSLEVQVTRLSDAVTALARQDAEEKAEVEALRKAAANHQIEAAMHRQALLERENAWRKQEALLRELQAKQEAELARLAARAEETAQANAALQSELQEASQASAALQSELEETSQARAALQSELQEASQASAALQSELEETSQARAALQSELQEASQTRAALEADLARWQSDAQEAYAQVESLTGELAALRAERAALQNAVQALDAAVRAYERTFYFRWRRRWRRFLAELMHGNRKQKRKLLRDLWRLILRRGRKLPKVAGHPPIPIPPESSVPASQPGSTLLEHQLRPSDLPEHGGEETDPGSVVTTQPYDVLLFPIIEWEKRFQRPQQLATQLAGSGHRVFCIATAFAEAPPGQPTYQEVAERVGIRQLAEGIYWVQLVATSRLACYEGIPPLYHSHLEDPDDLRYLSWSLRAVRERFGMQSTVSLVDLPIWGPLATSLPNNRVIYDCMDEHSGFSTTGSLVTPQELSLLPKADLVLFTARVLLEQKGKLNPRHLLLPNACDYDHFAASGQPMPADFPKTQGPVVGYYGAIAHWFDSEMLAQVACAHAEWTFVLVGSPFTGNVRPFDGLGNVHLLGEKPYADLPAYLTRFDLAIIPFAIDSLTRATNPVKFYEYAAAGKPVVSTPLPELLPYEGTDLVEIATDAESFAAAIGRVLAEDDEEKRAQRQRFAREQTWGKRAEALDAAIRKHVYPRVSVIILTYNNWAYTRRCLDSLFRHSHYPDLEVIIVDNCSTDETRQELQRLQLRNTKLVFSESNLGFAGGNNRGMEQATGDILILLNNDTEVTPHWVEGIVGAFAEGVGMVGPVTNFAGNDQIVPFFVGKESTPLSEVDLDALLAPFRGRRRETQSLGFYCVAISREVYDKVGALDEGYERGMFEDDDYCERVRRAGYRLVIADDVFIYHHGSASFRKLAHEEYHRLFAKNRARLERKWGRVWVQPAFNIAVRMTQMDNAGIVDYLDSFPHTAVITPTVDWHSLRQRPQQLARALARAGVLTIYVTPNYSHDRVSRYEQVEDNLFLLSDQVHVSGFPVDLLYVLWATNNEYLDKQAHRSAVYDYMDELQLLKEHCPDCEERHADLLRRSDLVTASSRVLLESVQRTRSGPVLYLPNGVDYEHFHLARRPEPPPDMLPILDVGKPVLGYYGAFARWIDFALLDAIASARPDWSLCLIGPDHDGAMAGSGLAERHGNVFWFGAKPYGLLPRYLAWFDVAAVPFAVNRVTKSVSPVKLFEYMAGGKPIISTDLPECRDRAGVFVARDPEEFLSLLDSAYRRRSDPKYLAKLDEHALANTWDARVRVLLEHVLGKE